MRHEWAATGPEVGELVEGSDYQSLLAQGRLLYPGIRIGRPGRSRWYWATIAVMRVLRLGYAVRLTGAQSVAAGPAILIGNHIAAMDPVMLVITRWWRVSAFTKIEVFQQRTGFFFRLMGQIPLRRGDEESTAWSMEMAHHALAAGGKLGLYPEGTRSPDPRHLHRLHKRILIPLLRDHPEVPVHAVTTRYGDRDRLGRRIVELRLSERLELAAGRAPSDDVVAQIRDRLLHQGGQTYVDRYAQQVKAERRAAREARNP